jgi:ABC-type transport system involved in multi-copper enzyme maturation permease subunit
MIPAAIALLRAEVLKIRRRRGLMAVAWTIAVGAIVVMFSVLAIRHGSNPTHNGPAGGVKNFDDATDFLGSIGVVIAAMIGATAGAGDAEAGVLPDLVASGRSRVTLFAARAAAGIGVTLVLLLAAVAVTAACSVLLNGSLPAPSPAHILHRGAAVLAFGAVSASVAVGIATFARSRGPVIAVVVALGVMVSQALLHVSFLGDLRALLPLEAFTRMVGDATQGVHTSLAVALLVTATWALGALAAGAARARRAEI